MPRSFYRSKQLGRMSTDLSRWIAQQLIDEGYIDGRSTDFYIRRTHAGHWQRSEGAWSWTLDVIDMNNYSHPARTTQIGSQWPASHIRKVGFDVDQDSGNVCLIPKEMKSVCN
jgi:hypothetical protein